MNDLEPGKFVTAVVGETSILTAIEVRAHQFQCDETEAYGGQDRFPDPYDYILSGLASCVAITLRQYADRHNLSLDRAEVRCSYEKQNQPGLSKKDKITKSIKLVGQLTDSERAKLMRAAKCPAHMMLDRGIEIESVAM
ncbi:MAG: OsmC family protein [Rhodothermales bacterium]